MKILAVFFLSFMVLAVHSSWAQSPIPSTLIPSLGPAQADAEPSPVLPPLPDFPDANSDVQIRKQIESLIKESGWYDHVKFRVRDGIVVFEGTTQHKERLKTLMDATQRMPGTVAVFNKIDYNPTRIENINPVDTQLSMMMNWARGFIPIALIIALFALGSFYLGGYLSRGVRSLLRVRIPNPFFLDLISRFVLGIIWITVFYFCLTIVGIPNVGATIIGGTGFLGLLIGLAFKGIAENYIAGILLASRSPFTKGDLIRVGNYEGYVQNLNMRGTTIIDFNGSLILIPNIMVIQSVVENRTANPNVRTAFVVTVSYKESIARVQEIIVNALSEVKGVLSDPAPSVVVESLDPSGMKLRVLIWLDIKEHSETRVKSRSMIKIKDILLLNGVEMPDATRDVVIKDGMKILNIEKSGRPQAIQERKDEIQRTADSNLEEAANQAQPPDQVQEELMDLAEKNPLPVNKKSPDLLEKSKEVNP